MPDLLTRARLLREHRRHEEAVAILHQHLAQNPDDPQGHLELALNRMQIEGMLPAALEDTRRANALRPDDYFPLALGARILSKVGRHGQALPLAEEAIRLSPEKVYAWNSKTIALIDLGMLAEAEVSARHAIGLSPENEVASDLLSSILHGQGKLDESVAESIHQLARDPESSYPFTNTGWAALERGQVKEAEADFAEALRLDPTCGYARLGLKETRRRSVFLYRWIFRGCQLLVRHPWLALPQIAVFGAVVVWLFLKEDEKALKAFVIWSFLFYLILTYIVVIAAGLAHFVMLCHPVARRWLDRREKADAWVTMILVSTGLGLLVAGLAAHNDGLATVGCVLQAAALPFSQFFARTSPYRRAAYFACGVIILGAGIYGAPRFDGAPQGRDSAAGLLLIFCFFLAAGLTVRNCFCVFSRRKED